ncbi:MAG: hypothetical protein PF590_09095 [Candidatus Delongbacteria bacterium]|jgi:hypothetical protein|nr:hypothetical protein [Candidatus Delongbacteria bacterium]
MVRNRSGKNTLFYGMTCLILLAGACKKPKNAASHLLTDVQQLVELQNEAAKDSVLSDEEVNKLMEKRMEIAEKSTEYDSLFTGDDRQQFCNCISNESYNVNRAWKQSNSNLFYLYGGSDYIGKAKKIEGAFLDCDAWNELAGPVFFTSMQATAQKAFADQVILSRAQIQAAKDGVITDDEIDYIIDKFKNSLRTYERIRNELENDKEKMNAFEAEIEKITTEFKHMNQEDVGRLTQCKNYDKLSEAMFEVMYNDK